MKNTFSYRHFLICNKIANDMLGHLTQNFAALIIEENMGRFGNGQMTVYFKQADRSICDLIGNDEGFMWDELDMDEVAELSIEKIEEDYENYCCGKLMIKESEDNF